MTKLVERSQKYASIYEQELCRIVAEGSYFQGYLDGMKDVAEATRCPQCGFLCFFPSDDGWRWCSNPKCKVGKVSADGEILFRREIPLKVFTHADVCGWDVPTNPDRYIPYGWKGTALDILEREDMPEEERLAYVLRPELFEAQDLQDLEKLIAGRSEIEAVRFLVEALKR